MVRDDCSRWFAADDSARVPAGPIESSRPRDQEAIDRHDCIGAGPILRDVFQRPPLGPGRAQGPWFAVQLVLAAGLARADSGPDEHRLPDREEAMSPGTLA